jgi:hypothetical protein
VSDTVGPYGYREFADGENPWSDLPASCLTPVLETMTDADRRSAIDVKLVTELDRVINKNKEMIRRMYGPKGRNVNHVVPYVRLWDPLNLIGRDEKSGEEEEDDEDY